MFALSKKQVKSLLEVISSDDTRPMLCQAKIDEYKGKPVLVATDSYKLVALALSDNMLSLVGKMIDRSELVKWTKLATARDTLTEDDLIAMPVTPFEGEYPKWQALIPERKDFSAVATIGFNAEYMATVQMLAALPYMTWEFYGKMRPMTARHDDNLYLVMPVKEGR